jgi:hypothetical protein
MSVKIIFEHRPHFLPALQADSPAELEIVRRGQGIGADVVDLLRMGFSLALQGHPFTPDAQQKAEAQEQGKKISDRSLHWSSLRGQFMD